MVSEREMREEAHQQRMAATRARAEAAEREEMAAREAEEIRAAAVAAAERTNAELAAERAKVRAQLEAEMDRERVAAEAIERAEREAIEARRTRPKTAPPAGARSTPLWRPPRTGTAPRKLPAGAATAAGGTAESSTGMAKPSLNPNLATRARFPRGCPSRRRTERGGETRTPPRVDPRATRSPLPRPSRSSRGLRTSPRWRRGSCGSASNATSWKGSSEAAGGRRADHRRAPTEATRGAPAGGTSQVHEPGEEPAQAGAARSPRRRVMRDFWKGEWAARARPERDSLIRV